MEGPARGEEAETWYTAPVLSPHARHTIALVAAAGTAVALGGAGPLLWEDLRTPDALYAFHADPSRLRLLRGPSQGGKTWAGAKETYWRLTDTHPWRARKGGSAHGWLICYSHKQSLAVQAVLHALVPRYRIVDYDYNESRGFLNKTLRVRCGDKVSTLEIKTVGEDTLGLASATLDFVWVDEPPPQEIYNELIARLFVNTGDMWITMTPVGRPVEWLRGLTIDGVPPTIIDHSFALTAENCPHLSARQIQDQTRLYLAAELLQRTTGAWEGVTPDRYLSAWDPSAPVPDVPTTPLVTAVALDHGERAGREYGVVLGVLPAVWPQVWALGEYCNDRPTTPEADARGLLATLHTCGLRLTEVDRWIGDVNSAGKSAGGASVNAVLGYHLAREYYQSQGLPPSAAEKIAGDMPVQIDTAQKGAGSVVYGVRLLNALIARGDFGVGENCPLLRSALSHWSGKDDIYKHRIDAVRYGVVDLCGSALGYSALQIDRP